MNINKRKKTLIKLLKPHGWELIRESNHFVFCHKITNRKLVTGKSSNCQWVTKKIMSVVKRHDAKYLPLNDNFNPESVLEVA